MFHPALANVFKCSFENDWLESCPRGLKPVFYRLYIADTLAMLPSSHAEIKYLSFKPLKVGFSSFKKVRSICFKKPFKNDEKCFLFHLKSSSCSEDF